MARLVTRYGDIRVSLSGDPHVAAVMRATVAAEAYQFLIRRRAESAFTRVCDALWSPSRRMAASALPAFVLRDATVRIAPQDEGSEHRRNREIHSVFRGDERPKCGTRRKTEAGPRDIGNRTRTVKLTSRTRNGRGRTTKPRTTMYRERRRQSKRGSL